MKAHASASAGKKSKPKHKLSHIMVRPAENGFTAEHHFARPEGTSTNPYPNEPEPETHVMASPEEMGAHVSAAYGGKKAATKAKAADPAEPDADD